MKILNKINATHGHILFSYIITVTANVLHIEQY